MPDRSSPSAATTAFRHARDFLLAHREDYDTAYRDFRWPQLDEFNYATDWFDVLAVEQPDVVALWIVDETGSNIQVSYAQLSTWSQRLAGFLQAQGVGRGDRVMLMLGNVAPLWVSMLACIRLGAVMVPATTQLLPTDVGTRVTQADARAIIVAAEDTARLETETSALLRISVGAASGWLSYDETISEKQPLVAGGGTRSNDPMLLYFTSGTTAEPKLVEHTSTSYPVGHLSTMYWIGFQPGDLHLNISSPGWAKHAWSSFFAPWNAGVTAVVYDYSSLQVDALLDMIERVGVTTFCAPPTVWRMIMQSPLGSQRLLLRECLAAGEPLNPEVVARINAGWGVTVRDGYGQTETTAQVGNSPGQLVKPGSMGRALPGYVVTLVDPATGDAGDDGELCLELARRPAGLMAGYLGDDELNEAATAHGYYHSGDLATRDEDGYITYLGRDDDVFKASDYRISPFELESVLVEHPAITEAAVVPSPHEVRLAVPKAFVALRPGHSPSAELALDILTYSRERLAPFKRIRRIEFADLPKTISGKIRRVELRDQEARATAEGVSREHAYSEENLPGLRG